MLNTFLKYLQFEKRYSVNTLISYRSDLDQFVAFLENQYQLNNLLLAEHRHIRSWIVALMQQKITPRSINRKMASLRMFYKFAISREQIKTNPVQKIQALKVSKNLPQFVHEADINDLLTLFVFDNSFIGSRDAFVMELLYGTGIRLSELIGLRLKDFNLPSRTIKVLGKGNKERVIPFHLALKDRLDHYLSHKKECFLHTENETLIVSSKGEKSYPMLIYRIVRKYLDQCTTIDKRSPHILRHTFATHLLNKGADLNAVKDLLGHSSLAATQVYTHNSLDKLKAVFDQAHPKA